VDTIHFLTTFIPPRKAFLLLLAVVIFGGAASFSYDLFVNPSAKSAGEERRNPGRAGAGRGFAGFPGGREIAPGRENSPNAPMRS